VSFSPNDTNPYAAPVPVEEDAPGYDLRKIARLYNRLGVAWKWFWLLLVIYISVIVVAPLYFLSVKYFSLRPESPRAIGFRLEPEEVVGIVVFVCLLLLTNLCLAGLWIYSVFVIVPIAFAMKYRAPAKLLIILGAIWGLFCIVVTLLMRRRAAQILRDNSIEIIKGRVDLANIPVDNDY